MDFIRHYYKVLLSLFAIGLVLFACKKDKLDDPYALPWNTKYIHYENTPFCDGSHSSGYELYYKDSLLKSDCISLGGISIVDGLLVNDSILHLFIADINSGSVFSTKTGGYSWDEYYCGPPALQKLHFVNTQLSYCVTGLDNMDDLYFTGIGNSNLSAFKAEKLNGRHYLTDFGTQVTGIDSTEIKLSDEMTYVILFR